MDNVIIVAILVIIIGAAAWYVIRAKKKGSKCIGCPSECKGSCSGCGEKESK